MEKWRDHYLKLFDYKSIQKVGFDSHMIDIIYADDKVNDFTVPLKTVIEELKWYKDLLYQETADICTSTKSYDKLNFCKVADTFITKWEG